MEGDCLRVGCFWCCVCAPKASSPLTTVLGQDSALGELPLLAEHRRGQVVLSIAVSWLQGALWSGTGILIASCSVRLLQLEADLCVCPAQGPCRVAVIKKHTAIPRTGCLNSPGLLEVTTCSKQRRAEHARLKHALMEMWKCRASAATEAVVAPWAGWGLVELHTDGPAQENI